MKLYSENEQYKLYQGNMLDMLEVIEPNSIDSIITDPPYGLTSITKRFGKEDSAECQYGKDGSFARLSRGFMGKEWDGSGIEYNIETWKKCYEVLKPGGYLLAFGGSRTFHRIACAIEDAGFEIRDTIMWLYGSGFPKSMNIGLAIDKKNGVEREIIGYKNYGDKSKEGYNPYHATKETQNKGFILPTNKPAITKGNSKWEGWGTALKPSFEPIIVARKPFKGSLVDNVIEYGVGGINIDECRVGNETTITKRNGNSGANGVYGKDDRKFERENPTGRFPANTILTYDGEIADERLRYFYCAKASKKDRDEGLEDFEEKKTGELQGGRKEGSAGSIMLNADGTTRVNPYAGTGTPKKNIHPTVKPTSLMQYLVRLVTPNGGTVLDPFNGSGSTGKAVMYENKERNKNYKYIGIELTEEYLPIAKARIEYVCKDNNSIY